MLEWMNGMVVGNEKASNEILEKIAHEIGSPPLKYFHLLSDDEDSGNLWFDFGTVY